MLNFFEAAFDSRLYLCASFSFPGLVIPAYAYSSHPNQLLAGVAFWDQFELWPELWRAIGTEPGIQGSNVLAWESFPSIGLHFQPTGVTSSLQYFSSPQVRSSVSACTKCTTIDISPSVLSPV